MASLWRHSYLCILRYCHIFLLMNFRVTSSVSRVLEVVLASSTTISQAAAINTKAVISYTAKAQALMIASSGDVDDVSGLNCYKYIYLSRCMVLYRTKIKEVGKT